MSALPDWMSFEGQEMFGSRYGSLSAYLSGIPAFPGMPLSSHGLMAILPLVAFTLESSRPLWNVSSIPTPESLCLGSNLDFCCWGTTFRFPCQSPFSKISQPLLTPWIVSCCFLGSAMLSLPHTMMCVSEILLLCSLIGCFAT